MILMYAVFNCCSSVLYFLIGCFKFCACTLKLFYYEACNFINQILQNPMIKASDCGGEWLKSRDFNLEVRTRIYGENSTSAVAAIPCFICILLV